MSEIFVDWRHRFVNFQWALTQLDSYFLNDTLQKGTYKEILLVFEVTLDLALKTMAEYMTLNNPVHASRKEILEEAFACELIDNLEIWNDAFIWKDSLSLIQGECECADVKEASKQYYFSLKKLHKKFIGKNNG